MNRVILMGRLTRDPEVRYSQGERSMAIARYTLAVDRRGRRGQDGNDQTAVLHLCSERVSEKLIRRFLGIYEHLHRFLRQWINRFLHQWGIYSFHQ